MPNAGDQTGIESTVEDGAAHAGATSANADKLIFDQELCEIYLLLDYISGHPDKNLSGLGEGFIFKDNSGSSMTSSEILSRVSKLRYPPKSGEINKADDAAFLLLVKDKLNNLAYPARGLTIAYTTVFAGAAAGKRESGTVRSTFAQQAYPSLSASAQGLAKLKGLLSVAAIIVTVIAAICLWQAAYGLQLASRFEEARKLEIVSSTKVYDELEKSSNTASPPDIETTCNINQNNNISTANISPPPSANVGSAPTTGPDSPPKATPSLTSKTKSPALHQACNEYAFRHASYCASIADVGRFGASWVFWPQTWLFPVHAIEAKSDCVTPSLSTNIGRQEDVESVVSVLTMMSNYILPILFGFVGSTTALVRSIQDKVSSYTLSPRDRSLAMIRLPLGIVAGVCVGLFLTPSDATKNLAGSAGAFTISASGIAFLAGYGAEAFFQAVDGLIKRLFGVEGSAK